MSGRRGRVLLGIALTALVAGCGAPAAAPALAPGVPSPVVSQPVAALAPSDPVQLDIPRIAAHSTLIPLGQNADGTVAVPSLDAPRQAGWYTGGPTPGALGPAVILGHVNARGSQGIFARLAELRPGDEIEVRRADGRTAVFTTTRVDQVPKPDFPTGAVYGDTADAELRLITCGGRLDRSSGSYQDNVIVYAVLTASR